MKDITPFKEALELKKLGFDEPCFGYYDEEDIEQQVYEYANCSDNVTGGKACYHEDFLSVTNSQLDEYGAFGAKDDDGLECYERWTAPTFSQAFRFFRKKYDLQCWIHDGGYVGKCCIKITGYNHDKFYFSSSEPMEYEDAELACLRKLIEIVKQKR
jgi:hypothetical protein